MRPFSISRSMTRALLVPLAAVLVAIVLPACKPAPTTGDAAAPAQAAGEAAPTPEPGAATAPGPAPVAEAAQPGTQAPDFVGKVWKVVASDGVEAGTTYAFLPDGTLVIESPVGNPPGYGKWRYADGRLSIEEEGATYPTDILRSDADRLELRSHNPGGTLDIKLERVPDAPLPQAP